MNPVYVGVTFTARADSEKYLPVPEAPSSYKDAVKIKEYIEKAKAKGRAEAAVKTLTGSFAGVHLIKRSGDSYVPVAAAWPDTPILEYLAPYDTIYCIGVKDFLRVAVAEHIDKRGKIENDLKWAVLSETFGFPLLVPGSQMRVIDPMRALLGSSSVDDVDYAQLIGRFKLNIPVQTVQVGPAADAQYLANVALAIAKMLGEG